MMRLLSWNVNGIRAAARNGLNSWLDTSPADIICFQEVKATQEQGEAALFPLDYKYVYWNDAQIKAGYSGVGTISR